MKNARMNARRQSGGFTLVEMMVSTAIGAVVIAGTLSLFISFLRSYNTTTLMRNTSSRASLALERMVYGAGVNPGLREAEAATVTTSYPSGGWQLSFAMNGVNFSYQYTPNLLSIKDQAGKNICTNVISSMMTNYTSGCRIWMTVRESAGGRSYSNSANTFVQFRN